MKRSYYLDLAENGAVFPLAPDLVLHENKKPEAVMLDGHLLGNVIVENAHRWKTPFAIPLMDLRVEKEALLSFFEVPLNKVDEFHFSRAPDEEKIEKIVNTANGIMTPRMAVTCDAIRYVTTQKDLLPIGMCIGPFSLMTKMIEEPITAVYMYGMGMSGDDDESVKNMLAALKMGTAIIKNYICAQIEAGAKAIIICEPAANKVYISPRQMESNFNVFELVVMRHLKQIAGFLKEKECDLIFHNCGELTNEMLIAFNELDAAMISLGGSRVLWEDAKLISQNTVIYGNLPTKNFYSDDAITKEQVIEKSRELLSKMAEAGHPFILGSECDVLSVPQYNETIKGKIDAMMECACFCITV
jgi:uroporphyrinogen decarboxylase